MAQIAIARSDAELLRGFPILAELRPHVSREAFLERVRRQQQAGYVLAVLDDAGTVRCVAGYRFSENLAWGRFLYVDDLVTAEGARGRGWGQQMLDWLVAAARARNCDELHLDSGVQRFAAHRFYLRKGMDITSHHFALRLR